MSVSWGDSLHLTLVDDYAQHQHSISFGDALKGVLTHHLNSSEAIQAVIARRDLELIDLAWTVIDDEGTRNTIWEHVVASQWDAGKNVLDGSSK